MTRRKFTSRKRLTRTLGVLAAGTALSGCTLQPVDQGESRASVSETNVVDEIYEGVADQAIGDLRETCEAAGLDSDKMFDEKEIESRVNQVKAETRAEMEREGF